MKSFKQFDEAYTDRYAHRSAEDDNKGLFNVQDPKSLQQLNGFVVLYLIENIYNLKLRWNNLIVN